MKAILALVTPLLCFGLVTPQASAAPLAPFALPAKEGTEWHYTVRATPSLDPYDDTHEGTYEMRVTRVNRTGDLIVLEVREQDSFTGTLRFSTWEQTKTGVTIRDIEYPGPLNSMAEGYAFKFLELPLAPGKRHDDGQWITRVQGTEEIPVPGFPSPQAAWKLSVIGTRDAQYTAIGDYWFLPGWGIVKSRISAQGWDLETDAVSRTLPEN